MSGGGPFGGDELDALAAEVGLPPGVWNEVLGLRRTFDDRGRLILLAWVSDGWPGEHLRLDPDERSGIWVVPGGSGGTADTESYRDGACDVANAWSDNQRPTPMRWESWVRRAMLGMFDRIQCLLCGRGIAKVPAGAHTADGLGHVCVDCLPGLRDPPPSQRHAALRRRPCADCGKVHPDDVRLFEGTHGELCRGCVAALRPVTLRARPARSSWRFWEW